MAIEQGWCPSECTLADRCYTNVGSYLSSETNWNNALTGGRYCLQGTASLTGVAHQSPTTKNAGGQYNEGNPPTIEQIKAELLSYISPDSLQYRYDDGPFYMRSEGTTVRVSGETFTDWCSGGEITIGDMWWTGTYWVYYWIQVWENYSVLKLCDGWVCPENSEMINSECIASPGYRYDEATDSFVPILPGEPGYVPPELCDGQTITYTLKYSGNDEREDCDNAPKVFTISYAGSTLTKDIDFNGPTSILFTESGSKDFDIIVFDYAERTNGQITVNIDDPDNDCLPHIEIFNIDECVPEGTDVPPYIPGIDTKNYSCCGYMPDEYEPWSDGYGVPVITAPKYR